MTTMAETQWRTIGGCQFPAPDCSGATLHAWRPRRMFRALASRVLCTAHTRIEGAWTAHIAPVAGESHEREADKVTRYGTRLDVSVAKAIFPEFAEVPYAD